jgi:hypothetical protein
MEGSVEDFSFNFEVQPVVPYLCYYPRDTTLSIALAVVVDFASPRIINIQARIRINEHGGYSEQQIDSNEYNGQRIDIDKYDATNHLLLFLSK